MNVKSELELDRDIEINNGCDSELYGIILRLLQVLKTSFYIYV